MSKGEPNEALCCAISGCRSLYHGVRQRASHLTPSGGSANRFCLRQRESTLWGTEPAYTSNAPVDLNGNGAQEFGELLPEANVLKAGADALDRYAGELATAAQGWQPTNADAFTALVVMVPTMNEYFASWKNSRFVSGDTSEQRDFVAISRLADMQDILGGLQVVYEGVSPQVQQVDDAQDKSLRVHTFVSLSLRGENPRFISAVVY